MMTRKRVVVAMAACVAVGILLQGCNTVKGAGRDIQDGGKAVENAAANTQATNATHEVRSHNILAKSDSGGSIKPSGSVDVAYGAQQTYTIRPYYGYHVADVIVDGNSVGAVSSHTFKNVTAPHRISAVFAANLK